MRTVHLFIAVSLDGYIADREGGVGWLEGQGTDGETVDTYSEFIKGIDTVLMGWNTYHQVATELSPGEWVYHGLTAYVWTHRKDAAGIPSEDIRFISESPAVLLERLKWEPGKDIWVCGGAELIRQLMDADAIDVFHLSIIPTLLGDGIRLFGRREEERKLTLVHTQSYDGIVECVYRRRG